MRKVAIAGAGFSGAVIVRELVQLEDVEVTIFEARDHVAGNCYTKMDPETGVMVHSYGPHIFHTKMDHVWQYLCQFGEFTPYENRVIANTAKGIFSLPLNLLTINQFFGKTFNPEEAREFVSALQVRPDVSPRNFEEAALSRVGRDLYENFFYGYTTKQWGIDPKEIPASVFGRLPLRYSYDSRYFSDLYQAIPKLGYTHLIENILDHERIKLHLKTPFVRDDSKLFDHVFYTGPLDSYFDYSLGPLSYRGLKFEWQRGEGNIQGNAVVNYCDPSVKHTRVTEYKHFLGQDTEKSIVSLEYPYSSEPGDTPFYPVRSPADRVRLEEYVREAKKLANVSFVGRLGTYRYINMDQCIADSLKIAGEFVKLNGELSVFPIDPVSQTWSLT